MIIKSRNVVFLKNILSEKEKNHISSKDKTYEENSSGNIDQVLDQMLIKITSQHPNQDEKKQQKL